MPSLSTKRTRSLRDLRYEVAKKAGERWQYRAPERTGSDQIRGGRMVDTRERTESYARRESLRALRRPADYGIGFERKIGPTLDFSEYAPDEQSRQTGRSVARIVESWEGNVEAQGFGSGFLVTSSLLMTNNHVLPSLAETRGIAANFGYEYTTQGIQRGVFFALDPDRFFLTDPKLDFSLVAVSSQSREGEKLGDWGFIRLIPTIGKIIRGDPVNIIQHPSGGPKQYATTENKLLDILEEGYLHYSTDTLRGSSGSPALNRFWELVALHHSGVPLLRNGNIIATDGTDWDPDRSDDEVQWVANEGVRVSTIVDALRKIQMETVQRKTLLQELLDAAVDPLEMNAIDSASQPVSRSSYMSQNVFTIQGNATIHVAAASAAVIPAPQLSAMAAAAATPAPEKKLRFDLNYSRRKGYDPKFLGNELVIPLPKVANTRKKELVRDDSGDSLVLNYHHFSLVMNKDRRLQMWSAVNVDYSENKKSTRNREEFGTDTWIPDPRIDVDDQVVDEEFYKPATLIDRGHIVRREDNAWGNTELQIEYANSDTFHWTNCTPQHEGFNQERQRGLWGRFEGHIQQQIDAVGNRASIFAGPVLAEDDPERDFGLGHIQYPLQFWKVVAAVSADSSQLVACGFIFDQAAVIRRRGLVKVEAIDYTAFERYQVSLAQITRLTGVEFEQVLLRADPLQLQPDERISIRAVENIKLQAAMAKKIGEL